MKTKLFAAILTSLTVVGLQAQTTITNYTTDYFKPASGWDTSANNMWEGQQGWTGNSAEGDTVTVLPGYARPGAANGTLNVDYLSELPSASLERSFTPMNTSVYQNISVNTSIEFSLAGFTPNANNDSFTFNLRDSGGTSLVEFTLQAPGMVGADYQLFNDTSIGGAGTMYFNEIYQLQVDLSGNSWTASLYGVDNSTWTTTFLGNITGGTFNNGLTATDFANIEVGMTYASGNPADPGYYGLIVNDITIKSTGDPIPEASTWAMGALLLGGLVVTVYRRRKAAAAVEMAA